jgi:hypothetical protein
VAPQPDESKTSEVADSLRLISEELLQLLGEVRASGILQAAGSDRTMSPAPRNEQEAASTVAEGRPENKPAPLAHASAGAVQPSASPVPLPPASQIEGRQDQNMIPYWHQMAIANFLSNLATLIVGMALASGMFLVLARRYGGYPLAPGYADRGMPERCTEVQYPGEFNVPGTGAPGPRFELGPTYADELKMREEAAQQQEEAVLRQLFEENLRFREQLGELSPSA